ncbi:Uncharacterised protein [uncultured archaeon]|nr:Uncharacterised protein [uncultured archaeon]
MARMLLLLSLFLLSALVLSGCVLFPYGMPSPGKANPGAAPNTGASAPSTPSSGPSAEPATPNPEPSQPAIQPDNSTPADNGTALNATPDNGTLPAMNATPGSPASNASAQNDTPAAPPHMAMTFYNVGEADATLIRTNHFTMLIDTGSDLSSDELARTLTQSGITNIDVLAISSWESGKLGGLDAIFHRFSVGEIWIPGDPPDSPAFHYPWLAIQQSDVPIKRVKAGDHFTYSNLALEIFNPPAKPFSTSTDANSMVMRLWYRGFCAFFPGDLQEAQEAPVLPSLGTSTCEFYKWPYHGRGSPTTSLIFDRLKPTDVLISVGPNRDGLPSPTTLTRLNISKSNVWRTATLGSIQVDVSAAGQYTVGRAPAPGG